MRSRAAACCSTTDADAALAAARKALKRNAGPLEEASHGGVSYAAGTEAAVVVVDEYLVVGHPEAVTAVIDASAEGGLSATEGFATLVGTLEPDRLVTYWVDAPAVLKEMEGLAKAQEGAEELELPGFTDLQTQIAGGVFATTSSVVVEHVTDKPEDAKLAYVPSDPDMLAGAPASAWFGAVAPDVGTNLKTLVAELPEDLNVEEEFKEFLGLETTSCRGWVTQCWSSAVTGSARCPVL